MSTKNPLTPAGIEPVTFRFVAQYPTHCATAAPTKTIHRATQITTNLEECGPCPVFVNFTLAFALRLRKKHGKTCQGKNVGNDETLRANVVQWKS